ncbi:hypothetical protein [Natronorubrum daqingense]|uniref:Uncharacterized protein n=1 Tax=Natronorubrum daqingense TaxID=588898 RepID=A0A1N7FQ07_9EURY|nr:hypothetical protein [Natronorubrum daqingense]SIS02354.1 hypothetical protein SAMN05421809_3382 [Natronorubrum daqingense]
MIPSFQTGRVPLAVKTGVPLLVAIAVALLGALVYLELVAILTTNT